jgi:hypothetical protein
MEALRETAQEKLQTKTDLSMILEKLAAGLDRIC